MLNGRLYQSLKIAVIAGSIFYPLQQFAATVQTKPIAREDVQRFSNALYQIKKNYVSPTQDTELFDNAIRGMLSGLDPHSAYLNEADFKELEMATSGNFSGLGIEITMENGALKVVTPLLDSPAYKGGIKSGDYIIKLGSQVVRGLSLEQAVKLVRGDEGSSIDVVILRKGEDEPLTFSLMREKIQIKSVQSKLLDNQYGYVRLAQFQESTDKEMITAIAQLQQQAGGQLKGMILDLRNNPGGLLNSAIDVADAFIDNKNASDKKMIVYTQGRLPDSKFIAFASSGDILNKAPLIVLINNGSASAAEIVAGALKDNKRAVTIGTKSFGKGSVQTVVPLGNNRAIKLTTALYYTPSGLSIQAKGITPDIVIKEIIMPKAGASKQLSGFNEASLSGHIANPNEKETSTSAVESKTMINDDFQLYSALTILKSLSVNQDRS